LPLSIYCEMSPRPVARKRVAVSWTTVAVMPLASLRLVILCPARNGRFNAARLARPHGRFPREALHREAAVAAAERQLEDGGERGGMRREEPLAPRRVPTEAEKEVMVRQVTEMGWPDEDVVRQVLEARGWRMEHALAWLLEGVLEA